MRVFDIPISSDPLAVIVTTAAGFLQSGAGHRIYTPNPEMLVAAHRDQYFKEVLQDADLNICDGKGIAMLSRGKLQRIPGIDFMQRVCEIAAQEGKSIYLLGSGRQAVVDAAATQLQLQYPGLRIAGTHEGIYIEEKSMAVAPDRKLLVYSQDEHDAMIEHIIDAAPDILFVGFGHSKQEKWIHEHLDQLPSVKIAMGVGGSLDVLSGRIRRAPKVFRWLGLEWLWRVIRQPQRIGRIWRAVIVFPYLYSRYQKTYAE